MKTLLTLLFAFCFLVFFSCQKDDSLPDEPGVIELDAKSAQLVEAENKFGFELFREIYAYDTEAVNTMVSPLSVSLALAMTYNGANSETKTAVEKTLKVYGLTTDDINQSYKSLVSALKSLDPKVLLEIANAIYYRQDFSVESDFISTNRNYYNAEVEELDFTSPQALITINNWVAEKTNDKIKSIIKEIRPTHVMFLLNAIYFKGIWQNEFDEDNTSEMPFYTEGGKTVQIPTMSKSDAVAFTQNNTFSAIELPYGTGSYNMYVFLPHDNKTLQDIVDELNEDSWSAWLENFSEKVNVDIYLPRLKYEYEIKLNDPLSSMGMGIAFGGNADFTGINREGGLYIDYVKHKTFIEVNEEGTEAAAVTVVAVNKLSATQNILFHAKRPFFYAITEKSTGAVLFMGTVKNPKTE